MLLVAVAFGLGLLGTMSLTFRLLSGEPIDVGARIFFSGAVLAICAAVGVLTSRVVGDLIAFALGMMGGAASIWIVLNGQGDVFATRIFPALLGAVSLALVLGSARLRRRPRRRQ